MEIKRLPLYYGGKLMPWGKATIVKGNVGFVFLAGTEGRDPELTPEFDGTRQTGSTVVAGAEAQTRMCLEKIRSGLEECGSSLEYICKMIYYIKGQAFPDGVAGSPTALASAAVTNAFFKEYCPELCNDKNPPAKDLIGVTGLGDKDMVIEIAVTAAIP